MVQSGTMKSAEILEPSPQHRIDTASKVVDFRSVRRYASLAQF